MEFAFSIDIFYDINRKLKFTVFTMIIENWNELKVSDGFEK